MRRLMQAALALLCVVVAALAGAAPAHAGGDDRIDISIVDYSAAVTFIRVSVKVVNKTELELGVVVHMPKANNQQRTLHAKSSGQGEFIEQVDVKCNTAQVLEAEYSIKRERYKPTITTQAKPCEADHNRAQETPKATTAAPTPSTSPKELAHTGNSALWWAVHVGPVALLLGVLLRVTGRRRRPV